MDTANFDFTFGDRRLIGQQHTRDQLTRILTSGRISHAYLFSGPVGVGKTAFALAFAEMINGIDHLTNLRGHALSKKSSWFNHPDIHVFLPIPSSVSIEELRKRLKLLAEDPYEIVNFSLRPSLTDADASKNRQAFYAIDYFRDEIRPAAFLKPNEGRRSVIIITNVEKMRAEASNAFLKLLEEPSDDLMFILTTDNPDSLLPTSISRCQHLQFSPLSVREIEKGLVENEELDPDDAQYLARISGGNYAMTRFYDVASLKARRGELIDFLRLSYSAKAPDLIKMIQNWQSDLNIEGQVALLNMLEMLLRDLLVYRSTENRELITNLDQLEVIKNFTAKMKDARLEDMIEEVNRCRPLIYRNVQFKLVFTALALRMHNLMKGYDPYIAGNEPWKHIPAFVE